MEVIRIDDIPLLYRQVEELGIQSVIDEVVNPHGNWQGISVGHLVSFWLCYLLSESDHRLNVVEDWASRNLSLLVCLSGQDELSAKDFTDDRLEQALDYLSKTSNWSAINAGINANSLSVYNIEQSCEEIATLRLDAAPFQGHHKISNAGLFQRGYTKHHNSDLGQLKIMLATLDNQVNSFAYPVAHITVSGEQADDGLYLPVIKKCEATFQASADQRRKLYVADSKMGNKANRAYIEQCGQAYLVPLSKKQLSTADRHLAIAAHLESDFQKAYKINKKGEQEVVALGFDQTVKQSYQTATGSLVEWSERQVFVRSLAYVKSQHTALDKRLTKAKSMIENLLVSKQGKRVFKTKEALQESVNKICLDHKVQGLLEVTIKQTTVERQVRAYKDNPSRIEIDCTFELSIQLNQAAIQAHKATLGWQVYATNLPAEMMDFEKTVWKYRYQNRIEQRFDDLRNKVVPLLPIYLQKDNRIEALINLLMLCLKICTVMEYKVAQQLKQNNEQLDHVYEGNPKRATQTPTTSRMLKPFKNISLVILTVLAGKEQVTHIQTTELNQTQIKIIELLGFNRCIYEKLAQKMILFSNKKISES